MKHSSLNPKRKTALPDRKFIIAIIVVTSALSFSLGYFVGGAGDKGKQPEYQIIAAPKLEAIPQVQEQPAVQKEPAEPKVETNNSYQDDIKYTVQAGAFKNLKEAEILKHKLETKGYKAYIKKYAKSKNPKLYKVRTGEFAAKEEAAALALKLKNEGLKAFVTLKNEEARGDKNSSQPGAAKKENIR